MYKIDFNCLLHVIKNITKMVITVRYYNNILLDFMNLVSFRLLEYYKFINGYTEGKYNSFDEIPNYNNIYYLDCSDNNLTHLPKLPSNLRTLICESNKLEYLPELPDSLIVLWCSYNPLKELPKLPKSILEICIVGHHLHVLPELPESLVEFFMEESQNNINKYKYIKKIIN
jgi:Leucine-rich repeat (LRR) protein